MLLFDCHCQTIFIWVLTMAATFYSQTKFTIFIHMLNYFLLLYNQTQSLFAFIPREQSERAQCYSCDGRALSSRPQWSSQKIKVYKILAQPLDIWEIVLCFGVILSFSVTTQITAAKQARLVIHSSKRNGRTLYAWSRWNYWPVLAWLRDETFLGKPEKP